MKTPLSLANADFSLPPSLPPSSPSSPSKLRLLHLHPPIQPLPTLIKPNNLTRKQRLLQRPPNLNNLKPHLQLQRHRRILNNTRNEFIRFRRERVLEALPVLRLHLLRYADGGGRLDVVGLREEVYHYFSLRAGYFGRDVVAVGLGAGAVEVLGCVSVERGRGGRTDGHLSAPVFYYADAVVDVVEGFQLGVVGDGANRPRSFGLAVLTEVVEREIDVVDGAVDEHAPVQRRISHEEPRMIQQVTRLAPHDERLPNDFLLRDLALRISIASVEAAGEARHDLELWMRVRGVDYVLSL
jgi:hypothetical protein